MSSHAEPRPSTDRAARDGAYDYQGGYPRHNFQNPNIPPNAAYARPPPNGYGPADAPRPRNGSSAGRANQTKGNVPPRSESLSGRARHQTQDVPRIDSAQPKGASGGKSGPRICRKCDQPLTGQFVRALGGTFHLECFLCRVSLFGCQTRLWSLT